MRDCYKNLLPLESFSSSLKAQVVWGALYMQACKYILTLWIEPESWIPDTEIYLVFKGGMNAMDRNGERDTVYRNISCI